MTPLYWAAEIGDTNMTKIGPLGPFCLDGSALATVHLSEKLLHQRSLLRRKRGHQPNILMTLSRRDLAGGHGNGSQDSATTLPIKWIAARVQVGTAKGAKSVLSHLAQRQDQRKTAKPQEPSNHAPSSNSNLRFDPFHGQPLGVEGRKASEPLWLYATTFVDPAGTSVLGVGATCRPGSGKVHQ